MPEMPVDPPDANTARPSVSAADSAFEAIARDIVTGVYAPGARLPAERELARQLAASRPTLREALRRLTEWRLIEPRRGSGIVVRDRSEWSIEVLPTYLRHADGAGGPGAPRLLVDLLSLRRAMIAQIIRMASTRIGPGSLIRAREALARAWDVRAQPGEFAVADFAVMRRIVEAARFLPALWLLNRLSDVYMDIARNIASSFVPPDDYMAVHTELFDALERADEARAVSVIHAYLERHDRRIAAMLEGEP